jgi:hypothetical protein
MDIKLLDDDQLSPHGAALRACWAEQFRHGVGQA